MNIINFWGIVLLIVAIFTSLCVGTAWFFAKHFCAPTRKRSKKTPTPFKLDYEEVSFSSQGVSLKGWFTPAQEQLAPQPTIVIAHGWSSSMRQMLPIAKFLHKAGFNSLMYDARSHGTSADDNPITLQKFAQDMIAAIDYLEQRIDVDMNQIGVIGHSMGGSGAILATSMEPRIQALVSSAAFADPVTLTKEYMQLYHMPRVPIFHLIRYFINRWLDTSMEDIAPINRIRQISRPILLLHSESDQKVSSKNMEILRSQAKPEYVKSQLIYGDVTHSTIILDAGYRDEIVAFFKTHLGAEQQQVVAEEGQIQSAL